MEGFVMCGGGGGVPKLLGFYKEKGVRLFTRLVHDK